ncbi:MAG: hypothetical protein J5382_00300 [Bacteroidales bacterium]|nr:hypothetical protein [Bacteroidales bacterium]
MFNVDFITVLGAAISMLLFYSVFITTENLYSRILNETKEKVQKIKDKVPVDEIQDDLNGYKQDIQLAAEIYSQDAIEKCFSEKRKRKKDIKFEKGVNLIKSCEDYIVYFREQSSNKWKDPNLSPAPLLTALTCMLIIGLYAYIGLNYKHQPEISYRIVFYLLYFSWIEWISIWAYPFFDVFKEVYPRKKERNAQVKIKTPNKLINFIEGRNGNKMVWIKQVLSAFLVYFILLALLFACTRIPWSPALSLISMGILVLLFGGSLFFIGGYRKKSVPYLNYYGQLVVILGYALILGAVHIFRADSIIPKSLCTSEAINTATLFFIILNGLTFPIVFPWIYYHILVFLMELRLYLKKVNALIYKGLLVYRYIRKSND